MSDIDNGFELNINGDDIKNLDVDIRPEITTATKGGVAAGDDIDDSSVNTGSFQGIQNSGHGFVDAQDAIIGNGNMVFENSEIGAFALGGNASNTEIDGENVLLGGGVLNNAEVHGDGQAVAGMGNDVQGDTNVALLGVDGPVNLAIGDNNDQSALEVNETFIDQSYTDNSVTEYTSETTVDYTSTYEDNDTVSYDDHSSYESYYKEEDYDVHVDDSEDTDVDLD
jgi:hypothetical protein